MSRVPGYAITVKLFIPAPKSDFKAQAAAATIVASIVSDKVLTAELVATAQVISADGRFTSMEQDTPPATPEPPEGHHWELDYEGNMNAVPNVPDPAEPPQSDETAVEGVRKAGRSRG